MISGKIQREGIVTHIVAKVCQDYSGLLKDLSPDQQSGVHLLMLARADETSAPHGGSNKGEQQVEKQKKVFHKGRNFKKEKIYYFCETYK